MIWKIFISALAIRWFYALILFATMGEPGLKSLDSYSYVQVAHQFAEAIATGSIHGWDWLGLDPTIMPIYNGTISLTALLFGKYGPLAYVIAQGAVDSATCVLIFLTAQEIIPRCAIAAAIAAVVNPTQIVVSGLFYPDTLFVFFVAVFLFGTVRWLKYPSAGSVALIAIGLSCSALVRILIVPWSAFVLIFLFLVAAMRSQLTRALMSKLAIIAIVVGLCAGAVLARNVSTYNSWALTSQGGRHLQTVVPWVRQAYDGTPWSKGQQDLMERTDRQFPTPPLDVFEQSRRATQIAREDWRVYGLIPTIKAWAY